MSTADDWSATLRPATEMPRSPAVPETDAMSANESMGTSTPRAMATVRASSAVRAGIGSVACRRLTRVQAAGEMMNTPKPRTIERYTTE
jgi:hypothetical protein